MWDVYDYVSMSLIWRFSCYQKMPCEGFDVKDPMWRIRCEGSNVKMWCRYHAFNITVFKLRHAWHNMEVLMRMRNYSNSTLDQVERCFHSFCFLVLFSRVSSVHVKPSIQLQISVIFFVYISVGISLITRKTLTSYLFWIPVLRFETVPFGHS